MRSSGSSRKGRQASPVRGRLSEAARGAGRRLGAEKGRRSALSNRSGAERSSRRRNREYDRERAMKTLKMRAIIAGAAVVALIVIYSVIAAGYRHKFLPNTHVNGFDVGSMSVADVEDILKKSVEKYRLELAFRGGLNETVTSSDIGLTYVSSNEVEKLVENQNRMGWIASTFGKKHYYTVKTSFHYDSSVLRNHLKSLPEFSDEFITNPKNSTVVKDADNYYRVSTEFQGNKPNEDVIFAAVDEAVNASVPRLSLTAIPDAYLRPTMTSSDETLTERADWLNRYLDTNITIRMRDGSTEVIDRARLASWAEKDDEGLYYLSDDNVYMKIYKIVEDAAAKYDDTHDKLDFKSTNLGTVRLKCSTPYGYKINVDSQTEKIFTKVYAHEQGEYEIENSVRETAEDKIGDTYIEVDITNQHVYYYIDGKLFVDTPCVTGLESDYDRRTPSGVYAIFNMQEDQILGSLTSIYDEQRYESHVNYWMPFFESYGMHDAEWRENFGGEIYLQYGSHGCVNLPYDYAKKIYQNLEIWTPVIVCRESDGVQYVEERERAAAAAAEAEAEDGDGSGE